MEQAKEFKISRLKLDYNLYPRHRIDRYHVSEMKQAIMAGVTMPPIIADSKSKRVVDGFHRVEAYKALQHTTISVIFRKYATEAEMFIEAMRLNAAHGRALTTYDKAGCIARAEELKLDPETIISALNMTKERYDELKKTRLAEYKLEAVALKMTTSHMAGETLTEGQSQYNIKAGGLNQSFYINQVIAMLEHDAVDWENDRVINGLRKLYELLEKVLKVKV